MTQAEIIEKLKSRSNRYEIIDRQYVIRKQDFDFDIQEIEESILTHPIDGGTKEDIIEPFTFMLNEAEGIKVLTHGRAMEAMETYASLRTAQLEAKVKEIENEMKRLKENIDNMDAICPECHYPLPEHRKGCPEGRK